MNSDIVNPIAVELDENAQPAMLEASVAPYRSDPRFRWTMARPSLEDVFIHTLARAGVTAS